MTKQELRHDSFVEGTARMTAFLQQNFMGVLLAIVAMTVLVIGTVYFRQSQQRSRVQGSQLLFRATNLYASGNYSEALITLDDVLSRYGGSPSGKAAIYLSGASHLALGENDAALDRLREYLELRPNGMYADSAKIGVALALEGRGDLAEAAQAFRELREGLESDTPFQIQASLGEARVLQALGDLEGAVKVLEPLKGSSDPQARQEAESRIDMLQSLRNS